MPKEDLTFFRESQTAQALSAGDDACRLNAEQLEAVQTTEGYVRVIAGAGTGKTRALSHRFAYLVNDLGIMPGNILCVTFTNKATNEMRQRIRRLTGDNDTGYINTFHSFCAAILHEDIHTVGFPKHFLVLDDADIDAMLKIVYEERKLTLREKTFAAAREKIEVLKTVERKDYYLDLLSLPLDDLRTKYLNARETDDIIFYGYLYQQKKCFALDYNDLFSVVMHIFNEFDDVRLKWQQRLEYVMVDEFQDIDHQLFDLLEVLVAHHKNLFIVGDPDQTIYSWRGADVKLLLDFPATHPGCKTIVMTKNYRSTRQVLGVVNSLICKNKQRIPKQLEAVRATCGPTVWHHAKNPEQEATWIAEGIAALNRRGVSFRDIAVIYRAHYASRPVEEALLHAQIPHTVYSGVPFFSRREVKDALCYLRFIAYLDDVSFQRIVNVPKRNMGQRRMEFLRTWADEHDCSLYAALQRTIDEEIFKGTKAKQFVALVERFRTSCAGKPVSDVLSALLNESGYDKMLRTEGSQERLDNVAELRQGIYDFETTCGEEVTLEAYLEHVALLTNADSFDDAGDKVKLMTIHAAKGLEFKHVFVCSLSEGVIPSRKTTTVEQMEEERRLAFVAMTRAKDGLYLSEAEGFTHQGTPRFPSRFLLDIDPECILFSHKPDDTALEAARASYEASDRYMAAVSADARFKPGSRVAHKTFGEGMVVEIDMQKRAYVVKFDALETTRCVSFRAPLEEV